MERTQPTPHRHDWQAHPEQINRFVCTTCDTIGYKAMGGHITPLIKRRRVKPQAFTLALRKRLET